MANIGHGAKYRKVKHKVLHAASKLFLEKGYHNSTIKDIAKVAGINYGSLVFAFKSKEAIVGHLVSNVFDNQSLVIHEFFANRSDITELQLYMAERALQICIAESTEHMREMYLVSYSLPKPSEVVLKSMTTRMMEVFSPYHPSLKDKDYFELEIAAAGIMRNYISVPCNMYFRLEDKIYRYVDTTLSVFKFDQKLIDEVIEFIKTIDYVELTKRAMDSMLSYLRSNID